SPPPVPGVPEVELSYSVLAVQRGDALVPWVPRRGADGVVFVAPGRVSVGALVGAAVRSKSPPGWWRVGVLVLAGFGVQLILVTVDLDWREDMLSFVAAGCVGLTLLLLVAAAVWREGPLALGAGGAALGALVVTGLGTHRS